MPAPTHTRVTLSGVFGTVAGPLEIWSFGFHCAPMPATTAAACVTAAAGVRAAYSTNLAGIQQPDIVLTRTRVAVIAADGKVAHDFDGSYKQGDDLTAVAGSAINDATKKFPLQVTYAVSLSSARPDATGKGRYFVPIQHPGGTLLQSDYRMSTAQAGALASSHAAFLRSAASAVGSALVVASGGPKGAAAGYLSNVTTVRVGRVLDTMRSRRNAQLEGYQSVTL